MKFWQFWLRLDMHCVGISDHIENAMKYSYETRLER